MRIKKYLTHPSYKGRYNYFVVALECELTFVDEDVDDKLQRHLSSIRIDATMGLLEWHVIISCVTLFTAAIFIVMLKNVFLLLYSLVQMIL